METEIAEESTEVKVHWAFRYENTTTEKVVIREGENITEQLTTVYPSNEKGECVEAYIWKVTDREDNEVWAL